MMTSARTFDARGMRCPMPVLKLAKEIKEINPGETLEVIADDPGFKPDVTAWCSQSKNQLLDLREEGTVFRAYIKRQQSVV
ncbi:MAG: sulfurtransferase TusA family protein [bacterium]